MYLTRFDTSFLPTAFLHHFKELYSTFAIEHLHAYPRYQIPFFLFLNRSAKYAKLFVNSKLNFNFFKTFFYSLSNKKITPKPLNTTYLTTPSLLSNPSRFRCANIDKLFISTKCFFNFFEKFFKAF